MPEHITTASIATVVDDMLKHPIGLINPREMSVPVRINCGLIPANPVKDERLGMQWIDQIRAIHQALLLKAGFGYVDYMETPNLTKSPVGIIYHYAESVAKDPATGQGNYDKLLQNLHDVLTQFKSMTPEEKAQLTVNAEYIYKLQHPGITPSYLPLNDSTQLTPKATGKVSGPLHQM